MMYHEPHSLLVSAMFIVPSICSHLLQPDEVCEVHSRRGHVSPGFVTAIQRVLISFRLRRLSSHQVRVDDHAWRVSMQLTYLFLQAFAPESRGCTYAHWHVMRTQRS